MFLLNNYLNALAILLDLHLSPKNYIKKSRILLEYIKKLFTISLTAI